MENILIVVSEEWTDEKILKLIDKNIANMHLEKVKFYKTDRRLVVNGNVQIFFRRLSFSIYQFIRGKEFLSVDIIDCYPDSRFISEIYPVSKNIFIGKDSV